MSVRDNVGGIIIRYRGRRCKGTFRMIDYKRISNESLLVLTLEHDPNRVY